MSNATSSGLGILGVIGIVLVTLKLVGGVIDNWSWWMVLLPFYGPTAIVLMILIGIVVVGVMFGGKTLTISRRKK